VHSFEKTIISGKDITMNLASLLQELGYSFSSTSGEEIIKQIKEKLCFLNENPA
jgi:hypothetical protein